MAHRTYFKHHFLLWYTVTWQFRPSLKFAAENINHSTWNEMRCPVPHIRCHQFVQSPASPLDAWLARLDKKWHTKMQVRYRKSKRWRRPESYLQGGSPAISNRGMSPINWSSSKVSNILPFLKCQGSYSAGPSKEAVDGVFLLVTWPSFISK